MRQLNHPSMLQSIKDRPVPSTLFGWTRGNGSVEESTLRANGHNAFQRVYNDACDEGFVVRSERTGEQRLFTLAHAEIRDGETRWWEFTSYEGPGCTGRMTKLTVWND